MTNAKIIIEIAGSAREYKERYKTVTHMMTQDNWELGGYIGMPELNKDIEFVKKFGINALRSKLLCFSEIVIEASLDAYSELIGDDFEMAKKATLGNLEMAFEVV